MLTRIIRLILCLALLLVASGCGGRATPTHPLAPASASPTSPPGGAEPPTPVPPTLTPKAKTPLVVFCAGSLIMPFDALEKAFESRYPNIDVQNECHGSIQVIRHVTELHEKIDVVATADASLIPMLMYGSNDPESGQPYASWYIRFATNRLALAYTGRSKYANEINTDNWYSILLRSDLKVGLADPRFDAVGYRALMLFALAQEYYQKYTLFTDMFNNRFTMPVTIFVDEDLTTVTVPEIMESRGGSPIVIRGASIQLIALLESGDLDYAFEYESVIRQHRLMMVPLPDALNLGDKGSQDFYQKVQVNLDFRRFATVKPQFRGEQIGYGITIPSNAPHPAEAAQFIAFLLGPQGRAVMEANYNPLFDPCQANHPEALPSSLQTLCVPESAP